MKKVVFILLTVILTISICLSAMACSKKSSDPGPTPSPEPTLDFGNLKMSYSTSYKDVDLKKTEKDWRDGMVGGNGKIGFLTNGSPISNVITYQHIDYVMPTNADRDSYPTGGSSLDTIRQKIINFEAPTNEDVIDSWDRIAKYHPGMQLRIDTSYSNDISDYLRYTNYETAEVGENYSDSSIKWERSTFASRVDDVVITSITNSAKDVSLSISIDTISSMPGFGKHDDGSQYDEVNIQYKKIISDDASYLAQIVHYPDYENSPYQNGGFGAVSLIIIDGGTKTAKKTTTTDSYNKSGYDASIDISNAKSVHIITALDKTKTLCQMSDFAAQDTYAFLDTLLEKTQAVATKYPTDGFSYEDALSPSAEIQSELFNSSSFEIVTDSDEDLNYVNDVLIDNQKDSDTLSNVLMNRVYNQGKYAMICCAGYSMTRLSGMWIGTWDPGWRYIYTMDANVNLQSSGMNTVNLQLFGDGYIRFVYNQLEDWETNAKIIYDIDDAIMCPAHADGDRAINDEGSIGYPFKYWNAGAAWMIQPIYEYYLCYGNATINTVDGDKDLLEEILLPMLQKNANFWMGLCTPKYYTDAQGNACYDAEKTQLNAGEKYLIIPSYSPENVTTGTYKSTLAANSAMDIAAAKESLLMAIEIEELLKTTGYEARIEAYSQFIEDLPNYQYTESGAIKEWCANGYNDNNNHRHLSHLYVAWPGVEMQDNETLIAAVKQALADREKKLKPEQQKQSHYWLHRTLIYARLKDADVVYNSLYTMLSKHHALLRTGLLYNSLMTNHDATGESNAYCTDSSLGLIGVINEALLYSNKDEIELLPACPTQWEMGRFTNLRARTQADVSCEWSKNGVTCTIKSDIDQTIKVSYKGTTKEITFQAGESKTITFKLSQF